MTTILVVDDEPKIAQLARDYLEHAGFRVVTASDARAALRSAGRERPDLIVLDLRLPDMDGLDVTRTLRKTSTVPIIMLTARDDESDKLVGLEVGADDYMTKPFSPKELVARVRAVLRRGALAQSGGESLRVGELVIDQGRMHASVAGQAVDLTATEFQLLMFLARSPGRVFTRSQLLDALHGVALRSEEHTSELQSLRHLVCRLLLE